MKLIDELLQLNGVKCDEGMVMSLVSDYKSNRAALRARLIDILRKATIITIDPRTGRETIKPVYSADQFKTSEKGATKGQTKPVHASAAERKLSRIMQEVRKAADARTETKPAKEAQRIPREVLVAAKTLAALTQDYKLARTALDRAFGK